MFKFFKEMIDSFKEGIEEGKQELKEEETKKLETENENVLIVEKLSQTEKFGTALGAPFRVVLFGDWFTLFGSKDDDPAIPLHLYSFGNYPNKEKFENDLAKSIERDFEITDKESCINILASYFNLAEIDKNNTILENNVANMGDENMWDLSKEGSKALLIAVVSHIITASTDIGILEKDESLAILDKLIAYTKKNYTDWNSFAEAFMAGNESVGLNNAAGRSVLKKYINYLKAKKGSPWNNIQWNPS